MATLSFTNKIDEILIEKFIKESCQAINIIYFYDLVWQIRKYSDESTEIYEGEKYVKTFYYSKCFIYSEFFKVSHKHSEFPHYLLQKYASKKHIN